MIILLHFFIFFSLSTLFFFFFFFFNDTATTEIYTLSLHDALPIPPCAHALALSARLRFVTRRLAHPSAARRQAVQRPARPEPTITGRAVPATLTRSSRSHECYCRTCHAPIGRENRRWGAVWATPRSTEGGGPLPVRGADVDAPFEY